MGGGIAAINPESGNTVTISGAISGPGQLVAGTVSNNRGGTLTLTSANNSFTGGVQVAGATLNANAAGVLGTGPVVVQNFSNSVLAENTANALTGTNTLIVNGGAATLSVANNYTGVTTVGGGTLTVTAAAALGLQNVFLTGGTLNANVANALSSGTMTIGGAPTSFVTNLIQTGGTFAENTANALNGGTALTLSGGTTNLSVANNNTGGVSISGTNITNVSAAGGLNGTVTMTGGALSSSVTAAGSYANNGTITVNGGLLTSAVAGGNFQSVTLRSSGLINPGGVGIVGNGPLTINNFNTSTGGTLQFDIQSLSVYDQVALLGGISIGSGTNLGFSGSNPTQAGNYKLISYTGTAPTLSNFVLPTAPPSLTYTLSTSADPGFIDLVVGGTYTLNAANWLPTAAGPFSWNSGGNWSTGNVPHTAGDVANFNSALTANQQVTVDGLQHVGTLTLNPAAAFAYTVNQGTAGSTIYLDNGASAAALNNLAQNNTINAPMSLVSANTNVTVASGLTLFLNGVISGAGKLTLASGTGSTASLVLAGSNTYTGGTEVDAGMLTINGTFTTNVTALNNQGLGTTILNGGTLNFPNAAGTTAAPTTGFVINVGPNGGTLNTGGGTSGVGGKFNPQGFGFFTGGGTLTKTGGGDLQISGPSIAFTGNVNLSNNGLIEDQSVAALGFGTATGFNGGSITINGPVGLNAPELVISGVQIFNPVTLNGGTLSANANNNGILNNTVTVNAASTLRASQFQGQTVAQNFAIKTLAGANNLSLTGSTTANAIGMVTIGDATGYTGAITLGANAALGLNSGASAFGGTINAFTNATSGIGLIGDGNGTSTPETIPYALSTQVSSTLFGAGNTTGYIVGKSGATTLFNQAANKTIAPTATLPFNAANTLNVQPFNGYGLLLANQAPLAATTTTFGVGTVVSVGNVPLAPQVSNVVPGLTLTNLTGTSAIVKNGLGFLQMGINSADASNTFTGNITINGGVVSAFSDAGLGNSANTITLNNTGTNSQFLALSNFTTARTINISGATGSYLSAAFGQTLTVGTGLSFTVAGNLNKGEDGTLVLTQPATGTLNGQTNIQVGALQISNSNQITATGSIANNAIGAALQLNNSTGATFTQAYTLQNSGIQSRGALENVAGPNSWSGALTISNAATIGNDDPANPLTISAAMTNTGGFVTVGTGGTGQAGSGGVAITGAITGTGAMQAGPGSTLLFTVSETGSGGALAAQGGTIVLSGGAVQGTGAVLVNYGGTLTADDTGTNTPSRTGGHTFTTVGGATFNLLGNSGATSTETFLGLNVGRGQTSLNVTPGTGQQTNLALTSGAGTWTHSQFSTATFNSIGAPLVTALSPGVASSTISTGPGTTAANFQGAGTTAGFANYGVLPWALVNNNGTISLATSTVVGANGFLRNLGATKTTANFVNNFNYNGVPGGTPIISGTWLTASPTINTTSTGGLFVGESLSSVTGTGLPANAFIIAINPGVSVTINANTTAAQAAAAGLTFTTTGTNIGLAGVSSGPNYTLAQTINSLTLNSGATLALTNSNQVLTVANNALGGAVLALDGAGANTISGGQLTGGTNELIFHTPAGVNLTVASNIVGGGTAGNSGITKADPGTLTLAGTSFHSGQTVVNAGTLNLNAGNNTIQFANYLELGAGPTVTTVQLNGNSQIVTDLFSDAGVVAPLGRSAAILP